LESRRSRRSRRCVVRSCRSLRDVRSGRADGRPTVLAVFGVRPGAQVRGSQVPKLQRLGSRSRQTYSREP
jgi:hypothetical protein